MTQANILAAAGSRGVSQGFKNRIINGAMVVAQRSTASISVQTSAQYVAIDRWGVYNTQNSKCTVQQNAGSVTPPVGFTNYQGITSSSAYASLVGDIFTTYQVIEGYNIADLGWGTASAKTVTLSFQVYSSLTGIFGGALQNGSSNRSYPFSYTISSANTWTSISVTITGDTSGTWATNNTAGIQLFFNLGCGSTYSGTSGSWAAGTYFSATGATSVVGTSGATFYITGVQLEVGSSATGFEYRQYQQELSLCQRYYEQINGSGSSVSLGSGIAFSSTAARFFVPFVVTKRAIPTITLSAAGTFLTQTGGGTGAPSAITSIGAATQSCYLFSTGTYTSGYAVVLLDNGTTAYVGASAEL